MSKKNTTTQEVNKLPTDFALHEDTSEAETVSSLVHELISTPEAERSRLSKILDLTPNYIVLLNEKGKILYKNKAFDDFFGKDAGSTCYKAMRGRDKFCSQCPPYDAFTTQSSCKMEWLSPITEDAFSVVSYPFEESKGNKLLLKIGTNITANLRMQQALDISSTSYKVITDNLAIGISVLTLSLNIKAGNTRLVQWFGTAMKHGARICEVLCCNGKENLPEIGSFCDDCPFNQTLTDGSTHEKEFVVPFLDGKKHTVRLVACPVRPRKGKVKALVLMLEDITKRLEVNKHLQKARKIEAMGTLAAGIAHEINQPLSALHLYASGMQMMLEKTGEVDTASAMKRMDLIMNEAEKIRSIIANMRALVMNKNPADLAPVSLKDSTNAAIALLQTQLNSREIRVDTDIPADIPHILGNSVQMEQVLVNLLSNAMHAIDVKKHKQSTLESSEHNTESIIRIQAKSKTKENKVALIVTDSGTGLPDARERIFDPFYTEKEGNEGMGLGLSIVHGLVRHWGGTISAKAHSKDLGGAEFYILLNIAK